MRTPRWTYLAAAGLAVAILLVAPRAGAGEEPGRLRWGRLALESTTPVDTVAWREALDLEGRYVDDAPLEPALRRGLEALARSGHPFAEARPGSFDVAGDRITGTIFLDPGVRARVDGISLEGAKVTRSSTALRLAGVNEGEPYTGLEDARIRERLVRSGLFTSVGEVDLVPGPGPDRVILEVPVTEPPYTRFAGVLGVGGPESDLTGFLDLDLVNISGTARRGAGRWENRGDGLTRFELYYHEPWLPFVPVGLEGGLQHDVNEGIYSYTRWEVNGTIVLDRGWGFHVGRGGTRAVEVDSEFGRTTEGYFVAGMELDRRNSAFVPTEGYRLVLESRRGEKRYTEPSDTSQVRIDRTRWNATGELYLPVASRWMVAMEAIFGFLDTPEDSLPQYDLFAVGGANSVRGYREEQFHTSGMWILRNDLRWLQDGRGSALYLFLDTGFIAGEGTPGFIESFETVLLGTGVGVRQATRVGILSVEYGFAKGESPLDGRLHLKIDAVF